MIVKIISGILIGITAYLNLKHGWEALHINNYPGQAKTMSDLGINKTYVPFVGIVSIAVGLMVLIPKTFFIGNLTNAFLILTIMALSLKSGNPKIAIIEIPFLIMPLVMIWLKYPFKN
ncbi:MAG TPA: hypothetical protein VK616_05455 [Flavitalea sp.]|nr:hypothetical protein [Flavitalea sp.]